MKAIKAQRAGLLARKAVDMAKNNLGKDLGQGAAQRIAYAVLKEAEKREVVWLQGNAMPWQCVGLISNKLREFYS